LSIAAADIDLLAAIGAVLFAPLLEAVFGTQFWADCAILLTLAFASFTVLILTAITAT
jgi:hypothetical protein